MLLLKDPLKKVPMDLDKTFTVLGKYHTTYKKHGISMDWTDRSCCTDMKHPHHVFLLQNVFEKMTFDTIAKVRAIHFPESAEEDAEPWQKFFYIVLT